MTTKTEQLEPWRDAAPQQIGSFSDKGPVRQDNQDACWVPDETTPTELGALYLVADGVGGQAHGRRAADLAIATARERFYRLRREQEPIPDALREAIQDANMAVLREAEQRQARMGSTMVAAVHHNNELHVAHVGDARAYLLRDGDLVRLTRDDTWVQKQVEAGLLTAEDAAHHELRNVVTQVLGNKPELTVNQLQHPLSLEDGDQFLLCSDGLYDALSPADMVRIMMSAPPIDAAPALVRAAAAAEAGDNITAVVVQHGRPIPPAEAKTMVTPAVTDTEPAPSPAPAATAPARPERKSRVPFWLLGLLVLGVLLLLIPAALWVLNQGNVDLSLGGEDPLPAATAAPDGGVLDEAVPTPLPNPTADGFEVVPAQATSTIRPTETAATETAPATAVDSVPDAIAVDSYVIVTGTGGAGVFIRQEPARTSPDVETALDGTRMLVRDGPEENEGITWWQVELPDGRVGWAAGQFLAPAQAP